MSGYDDYRHFRHVPNVRDNVKAALGIDNGREPGPEDFDRAGPEAKRRLLLILSTAKAVTADRYEIDPLDSWGVLEQLQRMRDREAARRIFEAEQEPADFAGLYLWRSQLGDMQRGEPLIHGVLDRHALVDLTGRDQTFKSFVAVSWLCCLATGTPWYGHHVEPTRGLYVIGEGAWGLDARVGAWEAHHGVSVGRDLIVRTGAVNLFRGGPALDDLLRRIEAERVGFVVFDTLRRCSNGANLNLEADAGVVVSNLDRVREATDDGTVCLVAHSDKGDNDTRGSGVLEDDADIVWRTKRPDDGPAVRLSLDKRKDGPDGLSVTLWPRSEGESLVLVVERPEGVADDDPMPKWAAEILHELRQPAMDGGASPTVLAETLGTSKGALTRAFNWLLRHRHVVKSGQRPVVYSAVERPPG